MQLLIISSFKQSLNTGKTDDSRSGSDSDDEDSEDLPNDEKKAN